MFGSRPTPGMLSDPLSSRNLRNLLSVALKRNESALASVIADILLERNARAQALRSETPWQGNT